MNTYLRLIISGYFDFEVPFDRKDFITYLYILFANDHNKESFSFANELLAEYMESNYNDDFHMKNSFKSNNVKR